MHGSLSKWRYKTTFVRACFQPKAHKTQWGKTKTGKATLNWGLATLKKEIQST